MSSLSDKAERAMIARLKQDPMLANANFKQQAADNPKKFYDIVVTCSQGEEETPPSGVYNLDLNINLVYPVRKPEGKSLADYQSKTTAVENVLSIYWLELAKQLTQAIQPEQWHCYDIRITGCDNSTTEKAHVSVYTCRLIAMGVSFDTADKLRFKNL